MSRVRSYFFTDFRGAVVAVACNDNGSARNWRCTNLELDLRVGSITELLELTVDIVYVKVRTNQMFIYDGKASSMELW